MDFFLKNKSDVYSIFLNFESYVHRQFNSKILAFHLDRRGEFQKLHSYFYKNRIIHRISYPHTHEQNGLSERKIRHIVDTGLTLMAHAQIPFRYWHFTFHTAINFINILPTSIL